MRDHMKRTLFSPLNHLIIILSLIYITPNVYSAEDDPRQYSIPKNAVLGKRPIKPSGMMGSPFHVYRVNGKLVGRRYFYWSDQDDDPRSLYSEELYKDGKPHGRWRKFFQKGKVFEELLYKNGLLNGPCYWWDEKGNVMGKSIMRNGSGLMKEYEKDGSLYKEYYLQNGLKHGLHKTWAKFSHGDSAIDGYYISNYESDKLQGWTKLYSSEDKLISESMWDKGRLHGVTRNWDRAGNLLAGYPKYKVKGRNVTKEEFEKAAKNDPILMRSLNSISNKKPVNEK